MGEFLIILASNEIFSCLKKNHPLIIFVNSKRIDVRVDGFCIPSGIIL